VINALADLFIRASNKIKDSATDLFPNYTQRDILRLSQGTKGSGQWRYIMDYGTVEFKGKEYVLDGQADFTNRLINGGEGTNFVDAAEGETYTAEFSAPAHDAEGNQHTVYWMHDMTKGDEPELDTLDWSNVSKVREA